jgi:hypothetical protein
MLSTAQIPIHLGEPAVSDPSPRGDRAGSSHSWGQSKPRVIRERKEDAVSAAIEWGSTADERAASYPCEEFVPGADLAVYRAIDIAAPVPVVFRWLCQLRVAPYSYDLLDNLGRRSPRELTPGADELEEGQRIMTIFHLASFELDRHITIVCDGIGKKLLGDVSSTYRVAPAENGSRLILKLVCNPPGGRLLARPYRWVMPWFDLFMMRKQFLNLKKLAEKSAADA